jgi:hypothetical protein
MKINYGYRVVRPTPVVDILTETNKALANDGMLEAYLDVDQAIVRGRKRQYGVSNEAIAAWKAKRTARCGCVRLATHPEFGYGLWDKSRCTA